VHDFMMTYLLSTKSVIGRGEVKYCVNLCDVIYRPIRPISPTCLLEAFTRTYPKTTKRLFAPKLLVKRWRN